MPVVLLSPRIRLGVSPYASRILGCDDGAAAASQLGQYLELVAGQRIGLVGEVADHQVVIGSVEHHVARRREADQLGQRERRPGRSAPGRDHHLLHPRVPQHGQRMIGDVGARQRVRVGGQDPRDVQGHVPVAHHDHSLTAEIDWQSSELGMTVEPRDDLGGGRRAGQPDAVDVEPAVVGCADRIQHGVMMFEQFVVREIRSHLDS